MLNELSQIISLSLWSSRPSSSGGLHVYSFSGARGWYASRFGRWETSRIGKHATSRSFNSITSTTHGCL